MSISLRLGLLGSLAIGLGAAQAQTPAPAATPPTTSSPATPAPSRGLTDTRNPGDRSSLVEASALEAGANSFTEGQARSRLEDAGFTAIEGLAKDDQGFWRARATHNGQVAEVAMDFRGRIATGPNLAALGARRDGGTATTGARPDGTPGNPPSTAVGRTVDQMQGKTPQPDGTAANPAGTAAGRAVDRATGSVPPGTTPPASR